MTIYRGNGSTTTAVLLARHEHTIRVAVRGGEDAVEFRNVHGIWVSEDCEPMRIEFGWDECGAEPPSVESTLLCPLERVREMIGVLRRDCAEVRCDLGAALSVDGSRSFHRLAN